MIRNLIFYSILLIAFIAGCSSHRELINHEATDQRATADYSVIYYIHADAGYLYHDSDGQPVRSNSRVLDTARTVAERAYSGEVFIIHQRPEKRTLGIFPQRNSRFYHYRNGQLISRVNYRHSNKEETFLTTEAQLLNRNRLETQQNYFFYYGHEIPAKNSNKYHQTLPDIEVNRASAANGIRRLLRSDKQRFDLVVLSTCNNGTPVMAKSLMPFTDVLLASPQNLHLSHIDSNHMASLETEPETSSIQLAQSMAEQTYQRLAETIQTTITLAVYDLSDVQTYINDLITLIKADERVEEPLHFSDNMDCSQITPFERGTYQKGVTTWYKPARFGRQTSGTGHSGWGCKPIVSQ